MVDSTLVSTPDQAAEDPSVRPPPAPVHCDLGTVFLAGLFCLAMIAALQTSSTIVVPVVFACIFNLLLQLPMRTLDRVYVPRPIGAVLVIALVVGSLVGLGTALSGPAASWAAKLPAGIPRLEEHLSFLSAPLDTLQRFLHQAERVAEGQAQGTPTIAVQGSGFSE